MSSALIFATGFAAQGFFSARMLLQWALSEKRREIVSPVVFWVCSLAGSVLLFLYGCLRDDFSIVLGQLISYYIYIWNLNIKGVWARVPRPARAALLALPAAAVSCMLGDAGRYAEGFFRNGEIPAWLVAYGSAGQVAFTLRFVYQWRCSRRRRESVLPVGFWVISLAGAAAIMSYAVIRLDPVLMLGQSVGFVTYTRNIMIGVKAERRKRAAAGKGSAAPPAAPV